MAENTYVTGSMETKIGNVPRISTELNLADKLGSVSARLSFNRMDYKVEPGLYAVGNPGAGSNVFVSANYKLSFDTLRRELTGMDAWLLVLDTKGINVWCAASEGTFGTAELLNRIFLTKLHELINHDNIIVPQLGAAGVSAHRVRNLSAFNVIYGPARAEDIPAFLKAGMKATPEMRRVRFGLADRAKLVGVEVFGGLKYLMLAFILLLAACAIKDRGFAIGKEYPLFINVALAYLGGTLLGPLLLPWLPGRAFSLKGMFAGLLVFLASHVAGLIDRNIISAAGWLFFMTTVSSFLLMNFTGASTYTSFSGVKKEMRFAVPLQAIAAVTAMVALIIRFV